MTYLGMGVSRNPDRPKKSLTLSTSSGKRSPQDRSSLELTDEDKKAYSKYINKQYKRSRIGRFFFWVKVAIVTAIALIAIKMIFFN